MFIKQVRLTRDITDIQTSTGNKMISGGVAYNTMRGEAVFFNFTAFGKTAEFIHNHLSKGDAFLMTADIVMEEYNGNNQHVLNISRADFLMSNKDRTETPNEDFNFGV